MTRHRPKLLLFSHICSPRHYTGAEKLLLAFAREMHRLFHCVLVVPKEGAISAAARLHGIEVRVLDIPLSIGMYVAKSHLEAELDSLRRHSVWEPLVALLQRERPACVWVNTCVHPLPAFAAKALGIPTVWTLMETIMDDTHRHEAVRQIDAHSDRVVGISQTVLEPFAGRVDPSKTAVLPPFIDRDELLPDSWSFHRLRQRRNLGWGEHHRVAGYIASTIYPNKGLKEFVSALLPLATADPRLRLLVVGNPTDEGYVQECKALMREAGLADRVAWLRFAERIEYVYPAMDVVIVPSLVAEGFGMAALEGMMFGKAVVSFASGGLAEVLRLTGNEAYLVHTGDVPALTTAAATLLQNDELRDRVGSRNARIANELFGLEPFRRRLDAFAASLPVGAEEPLPALARGSGPTVYRLENGRRRPFPSPESLLDAGYRFEDAAILPDERLALIPYGEPMPERRKEAGARRRKSGEGRGGRRRAKGRRRLPSRPGRGRGGTDRRLSRRLSHRQSRRPSRRVSHGSRARVGSRARRPERPVRRRVSGGGRGRAKRRHRR